MRRALIGPLALALSLGLADVAAAQDRGRDRERDDRRDRRDRVEERREDRGILERIIFDRRRDVRHDRRGRRDGGPAFCRSGEGHPVFGRRWCREKGFGLGRGGFGDRGPLRVERRRGRTLPEIILGVDRLHDRRFRHRGTFGRAGLGNVLGLAVRDYVLHDLLGLAPHRARHVTGRWHDARHHDRRGSAWWQAGYRSPTRADGLALQLFLDGERLAELADLDRDGRVDLLLARR